jgi:hypothetical protein
MYVVSLDGVNGADSQNLGRMEGFRREWNEHCGEEMEFTWCPGVLDKRRGYGALPSLPANTPKQPCAGDYVPGTVPFPF